MVQKVQQKIIGVKILLIDTNLLLVQEWITNSGKKLTQIAAQIFNNFFFCHRILSGSGSLSLSNCILSPVQLNIIIEILLTAKFQTQCWQVSYDSNISALKILILKLVLQLNSKNHDQLVAQLNQANVPMFHTYEASGACILCDNIYIYKDKNQRLIQTQYRKIRHVSNKQFFDHKQELIYQLCSYATWFSFVNNFRTWYWGKIYS
ncbi:Hypothetical_protein [Hexamita inflata]|uniref:Hypothetical_protein n=1 Tax=Hexamita inflata TaxID=28002 RepID=A0AA86PA05_9EUKA|nr:Hypothetical protein HINF_LOCUS20229 [Hexamita inflata]